MSAPHKFRSAFNGFNRDDVVGYLEYLNSKHTAQVNQLTSEADFLRKKLEVAQSGGSSEAFLALEQERKSLRDQLEELQEQFDALRKRCDLLEQDLAQLPAADAAPAPVCSPAEELEIYRRAERTERMARERADRIYQQANGVLNEASARVEGMAGQVVPMADQILDQLGQLQQTVLSTRQSLQDAVSVIDTLRTDSQ